MTDIDLSKLFIGFKDSREKPDNLQIYCGEKDEGYILVMDVSPHLSQAPGPQENSRKVIEVDCSMFAITKK